jgi:hypothetical protein
MSELSERLRQCADIDGTSRKDIVLAADELVRNESTNTEINHDR